jgi:hypothetical protein
VNVVVIVVVFVCVIVTVVSLRCVDVTGILLVNKDTRVVELKITQHQVICGSYKNRFPVVPRSKP